MNKKGQSAKSIEAQYNILRVAIAILISLLLAFVLIALVGGNPLDALKQFILEPISSRRNFGNVIELAIPLTFAGLAVCVMFQCNQFNMGVEGAFFFGGLTAGYFASNLSLPLPLHLLLAILCGAISGMLICVIPAVMKVKWNANEVVSSLMLNYVVLYLGNFILQYIMLDPTAGYPASSQFASSAKLPLLVSKTRIHAGLFLALILIVLIYIFVYKTKWGYSIRMVGKNENFARYSGIGVGGTILLSQLVGGALAGAGGATEVLGMYTRFSWVRLPGYGFDGIIIAILAGNNPIFVPLAAVFLSYLRIGADIMSRRTDIAPEFVSFVQSFIILLVGAKLFLEKYKHKKIVENSALLNKEEG